MDLAQFSKLAHPEDRAGIQNFFERIIRGGSGEQLQCRVTGVNGIERLIEIEGQGLFDSRGKLLGAYGACQDITDCSATEAALRESEDHYLHAVELTAQIPWTADPDGSILEVGPVWLELIGMGREEALGSGWMAALHPEDVEQTARLWTQVLATGAPLDLEYRLRLVNGGYRWFRVRAAARRNELGEIIRWYGTAHDIHDRKLAEAALRYSEAFARSILESTIDCVIVLDLTGSVQFINGPGLEAMEIEDFEARQGKSWSSFWPADVTEEVTRALAAARAGGAARFVAFGPTAKGAPRWWDVRVSPFLGPEGKPDGLLAIARDMSDAKHASEQLEHAWAAAEATAQQLENVLESTTDGVVTLDHDLRFTYVNRRAQDLFADEVDLRGRLHREVFPGQTFDELREQYRNAFRQQEAAHFERYIPLRNMWMEFHVYPSADGVNVFFKDVTERHRAREELRYLAHHDSLTGLANRTILRACLEQMLPASAPDQQTAVLFLDLDDFKAVNDSLGHQAGDMVLVAAAERLKTAVHSSDLVCRFGGDEFVVVAQVSGTDEASRLAKRIIGTLSEPYKVEGRTMTTGVSIGIAIAPKPGAAVADVKRDADIALYQAKAEGGGMFRVFDQTMGKDFHQREELKRDLRGAVAREEFHLVYQPLIDLGTCRIKGFEALLRWEHPEKGVVSPLSFIPLAEASGAIVEIGEWVLATACREAASWPSDVSVAVNLSPIQFQDGRLPETVSRCLSESGLPPGRLQLEITESVLLANTESNIEILAALRRLGASISMDDFGTGYSSLGYLRKFAFDKVKIDRSFVGDLVAKGKSGAERTTIVRAIIDLAHNLGLAVTAEGLETKAQATILQELGCDEAQGYLISQPVAAGDVARIMSQFGGTACGASAADTAPTDPAKREPSDLLR
ncbi:sensor domain-containing protein [Falsirhodobacter sp. 1013]|uniref:sensor domain-containing protein n=1 Tax=Falsirhodobacter sp. 1013 TaxID=3417566 RepID=UPI003EB7D78A